MADTVISSLSREYYRQPVKLTLAGAPVDPTGLAAKFAIVPTGTTHLADSDLHDAIWTVENGIYISEILVAGADADNSVDPAPIVLSGFDWFDIWWAVSSPPELMVRKVASRIRQQ